MTTKTRTRKIEYPESDGKPMGETDWHRRAIIRLIELLTLRFKGQHTYVSGDILMYYVEGDPKKYVVPDVLVVTNHDTHDRRTYRIWDEGRVPNVVIEVTSKKTRKRDEFEKPELYKQLGVRELFLFDPLDEYLEVQLIGYRLVEDRYQRLEPDTTGALRSEELQLDLRIENRQLQLFDVESGERLLDHCELVDREAANAEREAANARQQAAIAELAKAKQRMAEEIAAREAANAAAADAERIKALDQLAAIQAELARYRAQNQS